MKIVQFKDGRYAIRSTIIPFSLSALFFDSFYEYLDLEELQLDQEKYGVEMWWPRNSRLFVDCTCSNIETIKAALVKLKKIRSLRKYGSVKGRNYGVPVKL